MKNQRSICSGTSVCGFGCFFFQNVISKASGKLASIVESIGKKILYTSLSSISSACLNLEFKSALHGSVSLLRFILLLWNVRPNRSIELKSQHKQGKEDCCLAQRKKKKKTLILLKLVFC